MVYIEIDARSLAAGIAAANASFIDTYAVHGRMLRVVSEAADHNDAIRVALRDIRRTTAEAAARSYAKLQADGQIDPTLIPERLASVLGGATEHVAYQVSFLDPSVDRSELERTLNHVWLSTLTSPVTVSAPRRRGGRRSRVRPDDRRHRLYDLVDGHP